jgi:hypothetical protein
MACLMCVQGAFAEVIDSQVWNGHTYYLLAPATWSDSEAEAVSLGGHLATINDEAEHEWVWSTFVPPNHPLLGDYALWIGYTDSASEGNWAWVSGESKDDTNWPLGEPWSLGEPNAGSLDEDFAFLWVVNNGQWFDATDAGNGNRVYGVVEVVPDIVTIDIKPSKKTENVINVAIVGSDTFDALQVNPDTVKFGPSLASPVRFKGQDYNHDGFSDLVLTFKLNETGIACVDIEATLTGKTSSDPVTNIRGKDSFTLSEDESIEDCGERDDDDDDDHARPRIPRGHMPPPGQCRVWYPGRPPGHQPPPGNCHALHHMPPGTWLVRG